MPEYGARTFHEKDKESSNIEAAYESRGREHKKQFYELMNKKYI